MRRPVRAALCLALFAALAACASVLGVDKQYELGAGDGGADAGLASAPEMRCAPDGALCRAGTQECCLGSDYSLTCVSTAPTDPCPNGTDILCGEPADCATGVCCIKLDQGKDILGTTCRTSCQAGETALCAPGGTCTQGQCTALDVQPSPPIEDPWFYSCQ